MRTSLRLSRARGLAAGILLAGCDDPARPAVPTTAEAVPAVAAAARSTPSHYVTRGEYGELSAAALDGQTYREISLNVFRVVDGLAYLSYSVWQCDLASWDCQSVEQGSGGIPGGDLTSSHGRLYLDTSTDAGVNPEFERVVGSGGRLTVTWTELSGWSSSGTSRYRFRTPDLVSHYHGTYTTTQALVDGTVLGAAVAPGSAYASMGTVREGSIAVTRE